MKFVLTEKGAYLVNSFIFILLNKMIGTIFSINSGLTSSLYPLGKGI